MSGTGLPTEPLQSLRGALRAAFTAAKGRRPGPRLVAGALAGGWVGLAAALTGAPWGSFGEWRMGGGTPAHGGWIVGLPILGALVVAASTLIPGRVARAAVSALAGAALFASFGLASHVVGVALFAAGVAAVGVCLDAAVAPPWFARGRARGLLVALAVVTLGAAAVVATRLPRQLPPDAGPWWLVVVLATSTGLVCLVHAVQDVASVRLIARVGDAFEILDAPAGTIDAIATPGFRGRVYLGRRPVPQGRGAYRAGRANVPVVQLLTTPRTARRWLIASAAGLGALGVALLGLALHTGIAVAAREGVGARFLKHPPAAMLEPRSPPPAPPT